MNNIITRVWNQNRMVNIEDLRGMAFQAEDGGHTFEISGINGAEEAVELSGTVAGVFMRPDGTDVALTGTASDGVVSVTLSEACYAVAGRFGLTIFVTADSKKTCVYACIGTVAQTSYGTVAGDTPQDVVALINAINAAIASIPADYTDLMSAVAQTYSDNALYAKYSYAWYDGMLYRCKTDITTAESWTAAHWVEASLGNDLSALGVEQVTEELFETTDWVVGYLGTAKVMNATSNGDMRTSKAAAVHAGDTITVTIAIPLSEQYAYLYYAYVNGVNDLTYVSQRYGGSSKYNSADSSYRYYSLTIDVIADGYIVFSYRPHGEQISASHFLGSSTTNNIEKLDNRLDDAEDDISGNSTAIAANAAAITAINTEADYYRFPSDDSLPICVCHRGLATEGLPENTLTAYRDAKSKGWKWVETDIRMTSDGVWVCLHDASINRTARNADGTAISGTVNIADITYEQALTYDFGIYAGSQYAGTKILTLDDFLNYCNKAHLYAQLEIKNSSWTKAQLLTAWNIVLKYRMERKVMLLCSSIGSIDDLLEDYPYVPVTITRSGAWTPIAQADWATTVPYPNGVKSGKNKVYWEQRHEGFSNKADMQNYVDYCHYWGVNAGLYCPTTVSAMGDLVDTLDIVCSQYVKYDEVKAEEI